MKNTDDWCDIFVTTIFQREGLSDLVGRECGVERHIQIFKRLGIWNEDGGSTPKAGILSPSTGIKIANLTMVLQTTLNC